MPWNHPVRKSVLLYYGIPHMIRCRLRWKQPLKIEEPSEQIDQNVNKSSPQFLLNVFLDLFNDGNLSVLQKYRK